MNKDVIYVDVNMTALKKLSGELIPDIHIELKLVELYSYTNRTKVYDDFSTILLNNVYSLSNVDNVKTISKFFKYKVYLSVVNKFLNYVEILILKEIGVDMIDVIDITYDSIVVDSDIYVVRYKVTKAIDE